jgi:hypothetical protein
MKRRILFLSLVIILAAIFFFLIKPAFLITKYGYEPEKVNTDLFYEIFNDSVKISKILFHDDTNAAFRIFRNGNSYYYYYLENKTMAHIIEINELRNLKISDIDINYVDSRLALKKNDEIVFNQNQKGWPVIKFRYKMQFEKSLSITLNLNNDVSIIKNTPSQIIYFGHLGTVLFGNKFYDQFISIDYDLLPKSMLAIVEKNNKIFIVMISSKSLLDKSCIEMLKD